MSVLVELATSPSRLRRRTTDLSELARGDRKATSAGHNNNNSIEVPEYIVDPETKITYLKGKFLGKGGFARVHELTDLTTNRVYAGKIIPRSRLNRPYQKEKILREIDLHRPLVNKNVVRLHGFFGDSENIYIILEYCPRKSLVHLLKQRGQLTESEVRHFMRQLAEGVQYTHGQGVVHRDLKLGNMLLAEDLRLKIADFGLATRLTSEVTKKYAVCGTPNYIAPEVLKMQGHGFAADVWAMGCIMYAMLVGYPPFETSTLSETYQRIMRNAYTIPPSLSEPAQQLIAAMLHPDPESRPSVVQVLQHPFFADVSVPDHLVTRTVARLSPTEECDGAHSQETLKVTALVSKLQVQPQQKKPYTLDSSNHKPQAKPADTAPASKAEPTPTKTMHGGLMMTLSRVLCPEKRSRTKSSPTLVLHKLLLACLEDTPSYATENPVALPGVTVPFVTKWIDYSNKYGFGFQLSDHSVGVLFNDTTRFGLSADRTRIEYHDTSGKLTVHDASALPTFLQERYSLLKYFAHYMDENLTEGGDVVQPADAAKKKKCIPFMKRWVRTAHAIVMQLSCTTLQVNFFKDHTKLVINADRHQRPVLLYIDEERRAAAYALADVARDGCDDSLRGRLQFALSALGEFVEVELKEGA